MSGKIASARQTKSPQVRGLLVAESRHDSTGRAAIAVQPARQSPVTAPITPVDGHYQSGSDDVPTTSSGERLTTDVSEWRGAERREPKARASAAGCGRISPNAPRPPQRYSAPLNNKAF